MARVCVEKMETQRCRTRSAGWFGSTFRPNVWQNEGSEQTVRVDLETTLGSSLVVSPVIRLTCAIILGILEGMDYISTVFP